MKDFADRVVFVTGGASGIGLAIAKAFVAEGSKVVLADLDGDNAIRAAEELGSQALPVTLDIRDRSAWDRAVEDVTGRFGSIDVLCNNAGAVGALQPFLSLDEKQFRWMMEVNLVGMFHGMQAVLPGMLERDRGHIVNTASVAGVDGVPMLAEYSASKAAVVGLSQSLRDEMELIKANVGVSILCPGPFDTRLMQTTEQHSGRPMPVIPEIAGGKVPANDPIVVGPMVIDGIRRNKMFIFTEIGSRVFIENRTTQQLDGFDHLAG